MVREILVYVGTGDTARRMSDYATSFASALKAQVAGLVLKVDSIDYSEFERAITDSEIASAIDGLLEQRNAAHDAAARAGALFEETARRRGALRSVRHEACVSAEIPDLVMEVARLYDCVILPSIEKAGGIHVPLVEEVLLGSGRPVIVLPTDREIVCSLDSVVIAWDGSRPATRAVHDALPVLRQATIVDVLHFAEEMPLARLVSGSDLTSHLRAHGINARYEEVVSDGEPAGEHIADEALRRGAGLVVMGAYGHSRVREIVFGGTTRMVLKDPRLPVLLSY